jgi:hypothetical protein
MVMVSEPGPNHRCRAGRRDDRKGKIRRPIAVAGDPLQDITEMQRVKSVMKSEDAVNTICDNAVWSFSGYFFSTCKSLLNAGEIE